MSPLSSFTVSLFPLAYVALLTITEEKHKKQESKLEENSGQNFIGLDKTVLHRSNIKPAVESSSTYLISNLQEDTLFGEVVSALITHLK